jgi:hypothetical protein
MADSEQQASLRLLLELALRDLDAGRPAQGVAAGLRNGLAAIRYDDIDQGADDTSWRARVGIRH